MKEKKYIEIRRNARRRKWRKNRGKIIALAVVLVLALAGGALWHFQGERLLPVISGRGETEGDAESGGGAESSGKSENAGEKEEADCTQKEPRQYLFL